jgi:hypothetical protein
MPRVTPALPRRARQAADALQFVPHDGAGAWDNADGVSGRNYIATRAGTYRLADGHLTLLPPNLPLMLVRPPPRPASWRAQRRCHCCRRLYRRSGQAKCGSAALALALALTLPRRRARCPTWTAP